MSKVYKLLLNQVVVTHYREPFFAALAAHPNVSLTVAAGLDNYGPVSSVRSHIDHANFKELNNRWFLKKNILWQGGILEIYRSFDVVILPFNMRTISVAAILVNAWFTSTPIILWGHASGQSNSIITRGLRKILSRLAKSIIVYSHRNKSELLELGILKDKIFVAPNSIDVDGIWKLRKARYDLVGKSTVKHRILFSGRLTQIKKVDLLLYAFKKCVADLPKDVVLTIIGDGPERAYLTDLATNLQITDRIEFVGTVTDETQLLNYFEESLFVANPGHIGLLAIHAVAYGLPVLVPEKESHAPEFEALVPNENCLYFDSNSVISLASYIQRLVQDHSLRTKLSQGAELSSSNYSLARMVNSFVSAVDYST